MTRDGTCTLCGSTAYVQRDYDTNTVFFVCPICGRYELQALDSSSKFDYNHLASYFTYHRYSDANDMENEYRYHTVRKKEECDRYNEEFHNGINNAGRPVHIDNHIVETWYPKTFAERVDHILLYLNSKAKHIGQPASLCYEEMISALFIDRYDIVRSHNSGKISTHKRRDSNDCQQEATYMLDCLKAQGFIHYVFGISDEKAVDITITPEGYTRIDELQKYSAHGRNVLVAMKFGADTNKLREAIRKGITDAEYHAIFIDEVQHNDFITPELLKYIRDSKFVVVDLTHMNNGAYFEEGYAMGVGKPVIQLCQKDTRLHFDIAQKNMIMWDTEDDISTLLTNRIKATID